MKLLVLILLFSSVVHAAETPEKIMGEFLEKEARGERVQRLDRVEFTDDKSQCVSGAGEHIDMEVDLDFDPLYLITDFQVVTKKDDLNIVSFDVRMNVVGELYYPCGVKTISGAERKFKSNKGTMDIKYNLRKTENSWVIVNPPKPFVRCDAYEYFLTDEIKTLELSLARRKSDRLVNSLKKSNGEKIFLKEVCFRDSMLKNQQDLKEELN